MADTDLLPARGVPFRALVGANGIASGGTATVEQLAQSGMRAVCTVDSTGLSGGITVEQLAQRGIRAVCLVDDQGLASGVTADELRRRGIRPLVQLTALGLYGSTTMLQLAQRGLDYACLVTEAGTATSGFTPLDLTGLIGWWDASVTASLSLSGANVNSISDQSGGGNTMVKVGSTNFPHYFATTFNSRPGIVWTGTDLCALGVSPFPLGTGNTLTFFYCGTLAAAASQTFGRFASYSFPGTINDFGSAATWNLSTSNPVNGGYALFGRTVDLITTGKAVPPAGHRVIVTISNVGAMTMYMDGISVATGTSAGNWNTGGSLRWGNSAFSGANYVSMTGGEMGIATGYHDATVVGQLDTYLKNKWGL